MRDILLYSVIILTLSLGVSCSPAGGESQGSEFMPGMAHSIAYEANTYSYYNLNTYSDEAEYARYAQPRKPVEGTVARGSAGMVHRSPEEAAVLKMKYDGRTQINEISIPVNGSVAYPYGNTDDERIRAANEIQQNPIPITEKGLESGKELYIIYCGICHGEKGGGDGYLARDGSPYPSVPANLLDAKFRDTTDGLFYHAIMHGKNVMGAYADKLSYEERWNVIHYIRQQQAKDQGLAYSAEENTLNNAIPNAAWVADMEMPKVKNDQIFAVHYEGGHHGGHGHGDDHGHGDGHGEDHGHGDDHGENHGKEHDKNHHEDHNHDDHDNKDHHKEEH